MSGLEGILKMQAGLVNAQPQLKKLDDACQGMEAAFMKTLVTQMRKGTEDVHFGQQFGGEIFQDMFDDTLSGMLAEKQGAGMAKMMAAPMAKQVLGQALAHPKAVSPTNKEDKS